MESGASTSFNITGSSSSAISDADYLYLDPKQPRNSGKPATMNKVSFQEAFVFVVGGGNYVEYQNLQEFMQVMNLLKNFIDEMIRMFHSHLESV